ncbi:hypothetical protein PH190_17730, partial [Actinomycetospora straminea]|nr:hypothetical protein [Actinomycetospora straminea]
LAPETAAPETAASETVAPEAPAPVDIDPDATAERIAALWRTPPPDEILSDEHPISSWTEGPVGVTFGPGGDDPAEPPRGADTPAWRAEASVDPDAATGDLPVVGPATPPASPSAPAGPDADGSSNGRVRRARHSRHETGEIEIPPEAAEYTAGSSAAGSTGTPSTNGHHHGPEADGHPAAAAEPATGPVQHPFAPQPSTPAAAQAPTPPASSGPDSFDVQLSERERELLARLHEELASRERLAADAPDPLLGRPPQQPPAPPGSEDTTAPRPRPQGPPPGPGRPGRPGGPGPWQGPPPGPAGTNGAGAHGAGTNGHPHGPVNGHGLPRRGDHDDQDGPPRDA